MGFWGKIFGGGSSLEELKNAIDQQRFADARMLAEELAGKDLSAAEQAEVAALAVIAGDSLARLNLEEAQGLLRSNKYAQAREYLDLAKELVCSSELRQEIEAAAAPQPRVMDPVITAETEPAAPATPVTVAAVTSISVDDEEQLQLIMTSYPEDLRGRYLDKGALFKRAFLLTHAGEDEAALAAWQQLAAADHDDLYWFELGALQGRGGELAAARQALEQAVSINPELFLAVEALVMVLMTQKAYAEAEQLLIKLLENGVNPRFCHAQLTSLFARQGDYEQADREARIALTVHNGDPEFLQLAAAVFEKNGKLADAEGALQKIPGGGCGGGSSLPLAEYWLRHKKELSKALDVFNAACREDPDNPRWQLRTAQTYVARNWRKDGLKLLSKVVGDPRLEPALAQEAEQLLAQLKSE